jgi:glycosyltransferase involved in cell wall biosynthesis
LRDGFEAIARADFEWVFTLDGDGQHDPAEMPAFWKHADADIVVGNRMANANQMSFTRRFVNQWTSRRLSNRLGLEIPDSQCGFRLIRVDALNKVDLREQRFAIENEMLAAFARAQFKIDFVPISVNPAQRPSRIHPLADTVRWFLWWLRNGR